MKPLDILQEFEKNATTMGIQIIYEKGNFEGGFCLIENKKIIVINKLKPTEQRIWALSKAFAKLNTSKIYVKPAIREMIELNKESI